MCLRASAWERRRPAGRFGAALRAVSQRDKSSLVGLAGPWISGGVEFNWPQHHRPGTLRLLRDGKILSEQTRTATVPPNKTKREPIDLTLPATDGPCQIEALLPDTPTGPVRSLRDFIIHATPL